MRNVADLPLAMCLMSRESTTCMFTPVNSTEYVENQFFSRFSLSSPDLPDVSDTPSLGPDNNAAIIDGSNAFAKRSIEPSRSDVVSAALEIQMGVFISFETAALGLFVFGVVALGWWVGSHKWKRRRRGKEPAHQLEQGNGGSIQIPGFPTWITIAWWGLMALFLSATFLSIIAAAVVMQTAGALPETAKHLGSPVTIRHGQTLCTMHWISSGSALVFCLTLPLWRWWAERQWQKEKKLQERKKKEHEHLLFRHFSDHPRDVRNTQDSREYLGANRSGSLVPNFSSHPSSRIARQVSEAVVPRIMTVSRTSSFATAREAYEVSPPASPALRDAEAFQPSPEHPGPAALHVPGGGETVTADISVYGRHICSSPNLSPARVPVPPP